MKIIEILKNKNKYTFSFEFFPPKNEISAVDFGINVGQLMRLNPSFVSVTYGAGGSTQEKTFTLVNYLQNKVGLLCMAHYTCINATKEKVLNDMSYLKSIGINNVMLLRGDIPKDQKEFIPPDNGFKYASELIEFVGKHFDFCKAGACYVEKHPEAKTIEEDIDNLKKKVDAGVDFFITQLFFINKKYFEFIDKIHKKGIYCPVIPGIIPITSYKQIEKFTKMTNAEIPNTLKAILKKYSNDEESLHKAGVEYSINQCIELLENNAPGLHFYTLNKSLATVEIFEAIKKHFNV